MDFKINGNSAIVTASSSGLGKGAAASLVKEGVNVVINGRDSQKLDETLKELNRLKGGRVIACQGDITKTEDVQKLVKTAVDNFGRLDHLVTSAGGPPAKTFVETTEADWYNSYDLLVMSVVRIVKESLNYLKADGGGTVVNITSISVKEAIDNLVLSNSVRMTVIGLMKTLSKELGPEIRVNAVLPGSHETSRIEDLINTQVENGEFENYQEALAARSKNVPLKEIGDPENFGNLIAFLSSPKSNYINGSSIVIDGGESRSNL